GFVLAADPAQCKKQQREQINEAEHLEEDAPVARAPLLVEHGANQTLEHLPFPILTAASRFAHAFAPFCSIRYTLRSRSSTTRRTRLRPLHGPCTQRPLSGRYAA